ncbi:MAG: CRISPR-associated protein Cas4 [candidate division KSB1 bacterium]|nr:CRISPR-associated protein Cas4 [candidate division KSB1 bacterium]
MRSEPNSFSEAVELSVTPSLVLEFLFCPRFIYFMECLNIPQHEELRLKVQLGRSVHENKQRINKDYLRKKIGCIKKEISVYLNSPKHHIRGLLDEVLWLKDGTLAPMEYKFASYRERLFRTYKFQLTLQALMIEDNYELPVQRGFLVFVRSKNHLLTIPIGDRERLQAKKAIEQIFDIILTGKFPSRTRSRAKCADCCYKNICV